MSIKYYSSFYYNIGSELKGVIDMNIGNKLRSIREMKGMTIYRLSKETGISQNHIGGIELGKRQPTFDTLSRLLSPLGVSLSDFFNEDTEMLYLSDEEKRLIENYRCLSLEKAAALRQLSDLLQR